MPTRRSLMAAAAMALAARRANAEGLVIQPLSPTSGLTSLYARMANVGPMGAPDGSIHVEIGQEHRTRLQVWLPPGRREARALIFSHGELGVPDVYSQVLRHWASHGFAVIAPLHDDSVLKNGLDAMQRDSKGQARWDIGSILNDPTSWDARISACRAALDGLPFVEQATRVRISDERPIICGHSLGAYVAQIMLGARVTAPDGRPYENPERRFYAGILMSAQGRGILGLTDGSWDNITRPFMVMTGNGDRDATGQDPNVKLEPFALAPAGNKHLAWFSQVSPNLMSGQQISPGSYEETAFGDMLSVSTAFLSAYGAYDHDVFRELSGDYFEHASNGRLAMRYR